MTTGGSTPSGTTTCSSCAAARPARAATKPACARSRPTRRANSPANTPPTAPPSTARAARTPVSYLLVAADSTADLSAFDRWYERDAGERHGEFVLHRVRLRP
jgi:hypothetical protein